MFTNKNISSFRRIFTGFRQTLPVTNINTCGADYSTDSQRNSILVIDVSPSMDCTDWKPSRLKAAQNAAKAFVKRLVKEDPNAKVAIVTYSKQGKLVRDLTPSRMSRILCDSIDSIRGKMSTNITAGIEIALDLLKNKKGGNQVVLLSDGFHNSGPNPRPVSDKLREISIVECIGIGGTPQEVDEELLKYIASSFPDGSKRYRWIGDTEKLVQHFHNLAGRLVRA